MRQKSKKFRRWAKQHKDTILTVSLSVLAKKFGLSTVGVWKINKEFNIKTSPILVKKFCIHGHEIAKVGRTKDGKCRECKRVQRKKTYIPHPRIKKQFCPKGHDTFICGRSSSYQCNQCLAEYYMNNKSIISKKAKKYKTDNKEHLSQKQHEYYLEHKIELLQKNKEYIKKNKKTLAPKRREYERNLRKTDIQYRLGKNLRRRLKLALEGNFKAGSAVRDLGCTIEFLIAYLQDKFYGKISWDNYGTYWEIDHVKALWKFDLTQRSEFLNAVNFTNLQPLTKPDHKKKTVKEMVERNKMYAKFK